MSREPDGGETAAAHESARQGAPSAATDSRRQWIGIYLTGLCMGAADIVPGVSGGTIALIAGIYDRLIAAIAGLDPRVLADLPEARTSAGRRKLYATFVGMDLPFLIVLGAGVGTAFVAMSRIITAAFTAYPAVLNGFFFGLIAASAVVIYRVTDVDTPRRIGVLLLGAVIAFLVSGATESGGEGSLMLVFLAGGIAISAMVLPGISGAAFLYILGQYEYLNRMLTEFTDALAGLLLGGGSEAAVGPGTVVAVFMAGAIVGLLTMARVVKRAMARSRAATFAFLVGLMVGALRLPVEEAADETAQVTPGLLAAIVAAAAVGAGAVIALDRYTGSLEYT